MRDRLLGFFCVLVAMMVTSVLFAQNVQHAPVAKTTSTTTTSGAKKFDPHDFSGIWDYYKNGVEGQGIYGSIGPQPPPLTAWGKTKWDAVKPSYGPKRQAGGNDPIFDCTPSGIPRILFFPQPFEIVQTPQRTYMFFEREHAWRQIWTDGRSHPPDLESTWMGDSIGKWEGDTFVVDSVGFNDKPWLDFFGYPRSDALHLIERYRRLDKNTLELVLTVDDPKTFTKPWVGDRKLYKLVPEKDPKLDELFCVPSEEQSFSDRVRLKALQETDKQQ